jgi:penicillin-binding protein 2
MATRGQATIRNELELWRIIVFAALFGLVIIVFIGRLFTLQVSQYDEWLAKAEENSTQTLNLAAPRGVIYDRNGVVLASNVASYNVVVKAWQLPDDPGATQEVFRQLSALIGVPVNKNQVDEANPFVPCISDHGISQIADYASTSKPYTPVPIKCDIDERVARIIMEKGSDWPGVGVEIQALREYPTGYLTSSIVGFLGPVPALLEDYYVTQKNLVANRDKVGYAGLELQYQDELAGRNGIRVVEVDVAGQTVRDLQPPLPARPGMSMRLTIDMRYQQAAYEIISDELNDWNTYFGETRYSSGVVIAMVPKTGEILAMVSYPTYENNRMARLIPAYYYNQLVQDPANPLLNHAVGDVLPAGSVFKIVTGVGALNEGVVTPDQVIKTPPKLEVTEKFYANDPGRAREFVDWNKKGFGQLTFTGCLANSSNVCFYKLGGGYKDEVPQGLGICRLGEYGRALGYGDAPDLGLPDEEDGLLPDPKWKRINQAESWSSGDTYIASVGQGYVLATPIQVLLSASVIATQGKLMRPTLIHDFLDAEGNVLPVWRNAESLTATEPFTASWQVSPFTPNMRWDLTKDAVIQEYGETTIAGCEPVPGSYKTVQPWVFQEVLKGMRMAVTEGTLKGIFTTDPYQAAGKTGTAEYCDKYANAKNRCIPGSWPAHAWTVAFAPYDNPEIAVVAYVYNGNEGSTVAGPIVKRMIETFFQIKAIDDGTAQ